MRLSQPICNWKQGFGVVLLVCGPSLIVLAPLMHHYNEVWVGFFELWMGWRLWTVGNEEARATANTADHNAPRES